MAYFILDEISAKEGIKATDEDVEERFKKIALSAARSVEDVKKYYENEGLMEGLREDIREDKALEFLLKEAEIAEEVK